MIGKLIANLKLIKSGNKPTTKDLSPGEIAFGTLNSDKNRYHIFGNTGKDGIVDFTEFVSYSEQQKLTDEQKAQARNNIGIDLNKLALQSDYNQNDQTAGDYIKNRPFYTENIVQEVYIDNQSLTFEKNDDLPYDNAIYTCSIPDSLTAQVGDSLLIEFDGVEYELNVEVNHYVAENYAGCYDPIDIGKDIPLSLYEGWANGYNIPETGWVILTTSEGTSHTISIKKVNRRITKIPSKYIDSSKFKEDVLISFNYTLPTGAKCGVGTMEVTYKEIRDMISNNKNVIVYTNLSEKLILVSYDNVDFVFFGVEFSTTENYGGEPTLIFINNKIDGGDIDNGVEWNLRKIKLSI